MIKKLYAKDVIDLWGKRLDDENIISEIFDYFEFDCLLRCYVDSSELDEKIRVFYESRSIDNLFAITDLLEKAQNVAYAEDKSLVRDVKKYIVEHLAEDIPFEQIAAQFHVSYYYLCHLFKKLSGQSLNQFRTSKRLVKAALMLLESEEKISDVASDCGFDNFSYFSEIFVKHIAESPSDFRKKYMGRAILSTYELEDILSMMKMSSMRFLDNMGCPTKNDGFPYIRVHNPDDGFGRFLHEAAIIEYNGTLFASWYNCDERELVGCTSIVGRRSYDGGKRWTDAEILAEDKSGNILYCPPVYGICDGKLYMLINQMVSPDHMHSLDLFVFNNETEKFEFIWSRPIPFKLNTNVVCLPNGKLMLPGRIGELDGFPNTPAVLISDSGKIDAEWRVVKVSENGILPDGEELGHPETTVICHNERLYLFNRNDKRRVPLVYISDDYGETWSVPMIHDIPFVNSKIYGGTLSDGRSYIVGNTDYEDRSKLVLYVSDKNSLSFTKQYVLTDRNTFGGCVYQCFYPAATEADGMLNIIATATFTNDNGEVQRGRGAVLFKVDLNGSDK